MKILDASFTFDRNQLLFNFIADERVDFRELAKKLASQYKTRIELRFEEIEIQERNSRTKQIINVLKNR